MLETVTESDLAEVMTRAKAFDLSTLEHIPPGVPMAAVGLIHDCEVDNGVADFIAARNAIERGDSESESGTYEPDITLGDVVENFVTLRDAPKDALPKYMTEIAGKNTRDPDIDRHVALETLLHVLTQVCVMEAKRLYVSTMVHAATSLKGMLMAGIIVERWEQNDEPEKSYVDQIEESYKFLDLNVITSRPASEKEYWFMVLETLCKKYVEFQRSTFAVLHTVAKRVRHERDERRRKAMGAMGGIAQLLGIDPSQLPGHSPDEKECESVEVPHAPHIAPPPPGTVH